MSDDNQILIPDSFLRLFVDAGQIRPRASRDHISERHEWCEDMAQMLMEPCRTALWDLGITPEDVLDRTRSSLAGPETGLSALELQWVMQRLAELLGWPMPAG